jgi:hypothetical protein
VLVFAYCGSDWQPQASTLAWARQLPPGPARDVAVGVAERVRLFPNAGDGLMRQVRHNVCGHGAFLLGRTDHRALWYYFPVVLTIKLSVPLLLLPLLVACVRARALVNWAGLAALTLLAFSLACRVQIGVRFMLPLVALAGVGAAAAAVAAARGAGAGWRRRLAAAGAAAGVLWAGASAARVWPHGLCYVNELWGGTASGYRLVSDGNYDWGQGLKELARWQRSAGREDLRVWYYGTDPAINTLPARAVPLHGWPLRGEKGALRELRGHPLAVSITFLHGPIRDPLIDAARAYLTRLTPVARTSTFLIYDIPPQEPDEGPPVLAER